MKSTYIVICIGVVAVIGAIAWFAGSATLWSTANPTTEDRINKEEIPVVDVPDTLSGKDTLVYLMALGRTLECSFQFNDGTSMGEGTGFFDSQKMRIDSMYQGMGSTTYTSNLIINGADMYVWATTEAGTFAIKMPTPAKDSMPATAPAAGQLNPQDTVDYTCKPWNVDGSVFVPPSSLDFMDMTEMIKGLPTVTTPPVSKIESFTLTDVAKVTQKNFDPIKAAVDDEFTRYTITLKSGAIFNVEISGMMPVSMRQEAFKKTGYTGDMSLLVQMAQGI